MSFANFPWTKFDLENFNYFTTETENILEFSQQIYDLENAENGLWNFVERQSWKLLQYFIQFGLMAELSESELVLQKTFKKRYFAWELVSFCKRSSDSLNSAIWPNWVKYCIHNSFIKKKKISAWFQKY